jgi:hypothetical protein
MRKTGQRKAARWHLFVETPKFLTRSLAGHHSGVNWSAFFHH